jgi:hypothetical protein
MAMSLRRVAPLTAAVAALLAGPAHAAPDQTNETPMGVDSTTFEWSGKADPGLNPSFFTGGEGDCSGADPSKVCDDTLVRLADDFKAGAATKMKFLIDGYAVPASDYDIRVYQSDAKGAAKTLLSTPTSETYEPLGLGPAATAPGDAESWTAQGPGQLKAGRYYLVRVVYFAAAGGYDGTITLTGAEKLPPPEPTQG